MKKNKGFTIIELLVMVSAFVIICLLSFSFLTVTLSSNSKTAVLKEVRQNGNFALSVMERLVVSAKSVNCVDSQTLQVSSLDDKTTTLSCLNSRIASDSSYLTDSKVSVSDCNFVCAITEGIPAAVDISFTVSIGGAEARTSEKSSLTFQNKFVVRNQLN